MKVTPVRMAECVTTETTTTHAIACRDSTAPTARQVGLTVVLHKTSISAVFENCINV